ncbi:MAG: hypothetical protein ACOX7R_08430 [Acetivibrionales bacterium]
MNSREFKTYIIILLSIVICIGLFLSYSINQRMYRESHINAMIRGYKLAARQGVLQIEYALKYGKSIQNFYNMDSILRQVSDSAPEIDNIHIMQKNGQTLYSLYDSNRNNNTNLSILLNNAANEEIPYFEDGGLYYISVPILDAKENLAAVMVISLENHVLNDEVSLYEKEYGIQLILFQLGGLIIIIFVSTRIRLEHNKKRSFFIFTLALCIIAIFILGVFNAYLLYITRDSLFYSIEKIGEWLCSIIQMDINKVLHKGVTIDRIHDISGWLEEISSTVPEIRNLYINQQNEVQAVMSQAYIDDRAKKIIGSAAFIIAICVLLQVLIIKLFSIIDKKYLQTENGQSGRGKEV